MKECTIALIYHEDPDTPASGSVWVFGGDGREQVITHSLESLPGWIKLVGPVGLDMANAISQQLQAFLESNGVSVIVECFAD